MNEMDYVPKLIQIKKMLSNILEVYEDVGKTKVYM
jgi:hypothetical protein